MSHSPPIQILGHGLAGAILAETLSAAGFRIRIWDDDGTSSSRVAAGMYTPLTGRRLIPSWSLEEALPAVNRFYPRLERETGETFFFPRSTLRIFRSEAECEEWRTRGGGGYTFPLPPGEFPFRMNHGGCEIRGGGWVDLPRMLEALRHRRNAKEEWGKWENPGITIWAEGTRASENPLWREVGWRHAHGDILTLRIPDLAEDRIYNFGKFLVPLGNNLFRCGATYNWETLAPLPRTAGREELENELRMILTLPFETVEHRAGIRPVALARVPVAGPHPEYLDQWIFNGFGSKGVLLAPWMAERMRQRLRGESELPKETLAVRRIQRQRDREQTKKNKK
ncbi:MAG: NAD(P)/FAD-dependent oxidoreductase [Kiritimatiellia bacterium]